MEQPNALAMINDWQTKETAFVVAAETYRREYAEAFMRATGAEGLRKCTADAETSQLRLARNLAEVEAKAAFFRLTYCVPIPVMPAAERLQERPGQDMVAHVNGRPG